jgi:hypothetical protein
MQASKKVQDLAALSHGELERVFVAGDTPSFDALSGWEFRGYNHPKLMSLLGIRKFIKYFFRTERGTMMGCNTPVVQNGLAGDWIAKPGEDAPKRFGFYTVAPVEPEARDNAYLHALLLNYGRGGNKLWDPSQVLRDYMVRVERGSDELLLGKAYLALGPARPRSNFFILERRRQIQPAAELLSR